MVALDGLTFTVPPGQVFGFLGPNGSGKTTAMRAIVGVTSLDGGTVRWRGGAVDRARVGYMPEERGLYPGMRVADQLEYFARLHDVPPADARRAAADWIERLGLSGRETVRGASPGVLAMGLLWLLLGYALYSFAFAAAGSLTSRQADANNAAFPLYIPLIIGYVITDTAVWGTTVSPFFRVLTFIPFTAPVTMPALFAIGGATWWEVLLSALITIVAMVRLAGKIYERAILRTGTRLKLRQVLRTSGS